jgi:hypothetical protein
VGDQTGAQISKLLADSVPRAWEMLPLLALGTWPSFLPVVTDRQKTINLIRSELCLAAGR